MSDYKEYLRKHTIKELKENIIKPYRLHTVFTISDKTKDQLIENIIKHTELKKTGIYLKNTIDAINKDKKKHNKTINELERDIVRRIGGARGLLEKLKEDKFYLEFNDPYYYDGIEGNMPKKDKNLKALMQLDEDVKKTKEKLNKANDDYKKFKSEK